MKVPGTFFVNDNLSSLVFEELHDHQKSGHTGFLPAVKQIANVASLPGIVNYSIGLPDCHSGYGFAIGNVAAFDMENPEAVVSPGGVGFDINCGVRVIRTNLTEADVAPHTERLAQTLFDHIPVGVGSRGVIPTDMNSLNDALELGVDWSLRQGYAWPEDKEHCEEHGRMLQADPDKVSMRAKKRGVPQMGTLGAGNHYAEVQVVDEVFDATAARAMGLRPGQVVVMVHSGSRGLGHQVATDALQEMEKAMAQSRIHLNDKQLSCAPIQSPAGQDYLQSMSAAANYAWVNRQAMTFLTRQAFAKCFHADPDDLDMHVVYDTSHNIAKVEQHTLPDGREHSLLVHRKGATRAFPPNHPLIPIDYQFVGQPVLIGGSMGTCSYILTGTEHGFQTTFGSTCHGAGRCRSRANSRRMLRHDQVISELNQKHIAFRVASPNLIQEEAPQSYKDVSEVVDTCHAAGISSKTVKLRPIAVIKG
eukprot:gnl/Trimastix_PCT/1432.p1 GENE.gnl/Trimastix_PCT/1432~~gnl/Trimastix_PCT/1432.p1  ORF type:complete len:527 (-),score=143.53 gnl/Trimastix_PCT/1432:118-1545(-)